MPNILSAVASYKNPIPFIITSSASDSNLVNKYKGKNWAWGLNSSGQLGNNSITSKITPTSVCGAVKTFCQIAMGSNFSLSIDKNGRAWAWGNNFFGVLGDNSTTSKLTPISVGGAIKTFCKIIAGGNHSLAIDKNGRAWSWGINTSGQLGDNTVTNKSTPVSVCGAAKTFCKISGGSSSSMAIDKNGRVWGWGFNFQGNLGDNSATQRSTPVSVGGALKTFCQISAGNTHTLAIDKNGRAWGWGNNGSGQIGDNTVTNKSTPVSVCGAVRTFCQIAAGGGGHSLAIDRYGTAYAWGQNNYGSLGDNSISNRIIPVLVCGAAKTFCQIAAGTYHSIAIDKSKKIWCWGFNIYGQLGLGYSTGEPTSVCGAVKTFCKISAGINHSLTIDKNGRIWGWGPNGSGQVGNNSTTSRLTPVSVCGAVKTFCQIFSAYFHSIAIDKNGRAWAWGGNAYGQLGTNSTTSRSTPVSICGAVKTFCQIAAGNNHTLAIDKNGRAWSWGINTSGQLGDNSATSKLTPVSVCGAAKTFCKIAGGSSSSMVIDKNGRVWGWGINSFGNLGDNSVTQRSTPISVGGALKTFCQISAGSNHTLAIDKNGRAWGWGLNSNAQLGDTTVTNKSTPVSVRGAVKTFCQISSGNNFSLAIDKNGRAWGWGANGNGQLGDGTISGRVTPVSVCGATKTFCQITASVNFDFSLAIDKNGRAWGWGANNSGQLGKNVAEQTPIMICNF